jgi:hypothetical protein
MWPFRRKQKHAEQVMAVLPDAIEIVAKKWGYFLNTLMFEEEIPLRERIIMFSDPVFDGLRTNLAALESAPDSLLRLIVVKGIERSGTHTSAEIEEALGLPRGKLAELD